MIYVNTTGTFSELDEVAVLVPVNSDGSLVKSFNLEAITGNLAKGVTYYITMQSVTTSGIKSGYSPTASFSM